MIPLPAKRRKSNSSSAIPVESTNVEHASLNNNGKLEPASGASFRSATKASLARSQAELLPRILGRSAAERTQRSESRGRELHDAQGTKEDMSRKAPWALPNQISSKRESNSKLPVPSSRKAEAAETNLENGTVRRSARRALFTSQRTSITAEVSAAGLPDEFEPGEQGSGSLFGSQNAGDGESEPELPPTPTQLGLQKLSVRSRSFMSSSPSLLVDRQKRRTSGRRYEPSPLKPRDEQVGELEDLGADLSTNVSQLEEELPAAVREKKRLRDELTAQLEKLKEDVATLEDCGRRFEQPDTNESLDKEYLSRLLSLLTTDNPSCAPPPKPKRLPPISSMLSYLLPFSVPQHIPKLELQRPVTPPPENPFALEQLSDPLPYLTLFAPLTLSTHTTTTSSSWKTLGSSSRLIQKHEFVLSPPRGFPQSIYKIPITLETDPELQRILSITIPDSSEASDVANIPSQLHRWMHTRLSNQLLKLDISGLSWGVCRYWEACISRAKIWTLLEKLQSNVTKGTRLKDTSSREDSEPEKNPRALVPHLDRSSSLFSGPRGTGSYQIMVSCPIEIDLWTSEPFLQPDICISTSTSPRSSGGAETKIEIEARRVFWTILKHRSADVEIDCGIIVGAVEAVVRVLYGEE
ncbi:hypothetical protein D8B26_004690 [Coccidioides posadasii str. Silveira]|uniref:Uncharacterized protein n=1 Tax=Coccidioides posadasii (strain RMSCC 757 / Silveira) TaxID=443226 RepID=E9D6Y2_COCPS|nr:conserved hypothetical protein [Coccidioides posadasii str. Silveira]QVM10027.1 hypothetical protein D8B26_004690 [Coccidioides posadasii str. Silveira]